MGRLRGRVALWAVLAAVAIAGHGPPQARAEQVRTVAPPSSRDLSETLRRIMAEASLGDATVGALFVDVETGEVIFARGADELLNPASNTKIVTAAAALAILGPEFRYDTTLCGETDGSAVDGPLYLQGRGDPTLTTEDMWGLAMELARNGVRAVRGDLVVDASYFDNETEPPAFDQQPDERQPFRATVGGINVNRNIVAVVVRPAGTAGRPAVVTSDPAGYLELVNDTVTVEVGAPAIRFATRASGNGTSARVWGSLPLLQRPVRQRSRADNPALLAGAAMAEALRGAGVTLRGRVVEGQTASRAAVLASHRSTPLSSILWLVGKNSDNFVAETLLKTMGAEASTPGTWEGGRSEARRYLSAIGVDQASYRLVNGSGLFDANRFSARQLATVLVAAWRDPGIRHEFVSQLAIGGVDGTLHNRFRAAPALRNVRAKTGTLNDVVALSGYVLAPAGRSTIAFSVLVNDARGSLGTGRQLQDRLVTAVAEHLHQP